MVRMHFFAGLLFSLLLMSVSGAADTAADCSANFTQSGSFFAGKKSSTWLQLPNTARSDAYSRIYATLAKDGWNVTNGDKDAGVISAVQTVSFGKGAVAPLSVVIEAAGAGSKATITFSTAGGQSANTDTVKTKLCSYLLAAVTSQ